MSCVINFFMWTKRSNRLVPKKTSASNIWPHNDKKLRWPLLLCAIPLMSVVPFLIPIGLLWTPSTLLAFNPHPALINPSSSPPPTLVQSSSSPRPSLMQPSSSPWNESFKTAPWFAKGLWKLKHLHGYLFTYSFSHEHPSSVAASLQVKRSSSRKPAGNFDIINFQKRGRPQGQTHLLNFFFRERAMACRCLWLISISWLWN